MRRRFWIIALITFLLDQLSKQAVVFWLDLKTIGLIEVLPPYLNFTMGWNRGINFGLLQMGDAGRWVWVGLSLIIAGWLTIWLMRAPARKWALIGGGLVVGGALGNVIDRVRFGAVADFLNMSCCGIRNPYAFNIADIAIFAGAVLLIIFAPDNSDKKQA